MAAGTDQHHWIVRSGAVEFLTTGMAARVKLGLVIAPREDPLAWFQGGGAGRDGVQQCFQCRRGLWFGIHPQHAHAKRDKVQMRIVKAGRRQSPLEIDDAGPRTDERGDLGVAASRQYLVLKDRKCLHDTVVAPAPDRPVAQYDICLNRHSLLPLPCLRRA